MLAVIAKSLFRAQACSNFLARTMSSWTIEKNCRMGMSIEEKRRSYKVKSFLQLSDVPALSEQIESLPPPSDSDVELFKKQNLTLDASLNAQLAEKVSIWNGDITQFEVDAIVNAANSSLLGGGGVDGAIHRAAGPLLVEECRSIKGCPTGEARITGGYLLPAKNVIHTVGPQNKSAEKLESCYFSCFTLMRTNELKSIVFPCVATGIYGFPHEKAAHIACNLTRRYLEEDAKEHGGSAERVIFCTFDPVDYNIYKSVAQLYFPVK